MTLEKLYLSTIDEQAHLLAGQYGLGLEIAEFCTASRMDLQLAETARAVERKLTFAGGYVLHGPFNELFPCAIDPKARELAAYRFRQAVKLAAQFGISKIVLHGGYNPRIYFPCWYTEQSVLFWRAFLPEIPEGMTVCLENVLEEQPEWLADIIRQVDSPKLRMCLDVGHVNAYSPIPAGDWIARCGDCIRHFHIHNNDGTWDAHGHLFEGTLPMEDLLHAVRRTCPDASITLELPDAAPSLRWLAERGLLAEPDVSQSHDTEAQV